MPTRRDFLKTTAALAAAPCLVLQAFAQQAPASGVEMFADFEAAGYDGWTLEGDCWTGTPASDRTFSGRIRGFEGQRFLCTLHPLRGAGATGRAISREFRIERPFIDFLIGGGKYPGEACLNLVVDAQVVRTETGDDTPEFRRACWDVSDLIGKKAHFEIVDSTQATARGYVMVDAIRLTDFPIFQERVTGQNAFFCFSQEDTAGRAFQTLYATPEGRNQRALTDVCVDRLTERLALGVGKVDRKDLKQCALLVRTEIDRILSLYQVKDALTKQLIAANACSAFAALLTTYDTELADQIESRPLSYTDHANFMRRPEVVLQRGKAVCSGIAALEQSFALACQDLGLECLVANGSTRHPDNTPYTTTNHSWTLYYMADKNLWAPSDTTRALNTLKAAKKPPQEKFASASLLLIDPLLRDMYTLFHFVKQCRVGYPGTDVNSRIVNPLEQKEWSRFHTAHPYVLKSARTLLATIDKADITRLA